MAYFRIPNRILAGQNAVKEALPYLQMCGKKAFIVTGRHVGKSSMMDKLVKVLQDGGITYVLYDGITGEPDIEMIEVGVSIYQESGCDFFIGIGGGSPLDAAKAISLMTCYKGELPELMGQSITMSSPPVVAIPTTAGTGSEVTKFTIITDSKNDVKMLLAGDSLLPDMAIIDSGFTMDMPKPITAATGLDALTHAVEAYTSKKATDLTDVFAISAIKRIMKYLPVAYENGCDATARKEMTLAAYEAGVCINNASVTLVHGMSRPIGALFHVPHGISNAMLLPECLIFAKEGALERFAKLAYETGIAKIEDSSDVAADKFLQAVRSVCKTCEVPTLQEYGIDEEDYQRNISKMASDAIASGSPGNTRKTVTVQDCGAIYKQVYK